MSDRVYKRLICIVLCVVITFVLIGCDESPAEMRVEQRIEQMTLVYAYTPFRIYRHESTGVYYLVNNYGGITIMVNADGTPYIGVNYG